jgi:hypothetical protein
MLQVGVERTIPLQEAQSRLDEIVQEAASGQIWVITQNDQPQAAVINVRYLDALLQQTWPEGEEWYRLVQASLAVFGIILTKTFIPSLMENLYEPPLAPATRRGCAGLLCCHTAARPTHPHWS